MDSNILRDLLSYDEVSGAFTWNESRGSVKKGSLAGYLGSGGYWQIKVSGSLYLAHRLAWLYVHGIWPDDQLDHKDGDRLNNSISNLRQCNSAQNHQNRRSVSGSTSSSVGVCWEEGRKRWRADIKVEGKPRYLGRFLTEAEAISAYAKAKRDIHTFSPEARNG